ncbi:hypothetical protein FEM48_Zijuj12G0062100 [Ziziphus jujuba var. spinosa]|uniref:Uncharacterized protein n=1 Tax=Ziziphus jujuba var. spinosa TaxID=714518 RepID=A0A978UBM7_ZIZJJ|nr:hypothetical protein FEM48_Zijuj12G0062100 [Ziziphus jujuba var. spinosa]
MRLISIILVLFSFRILSSSTNVFLVHGAPTQKHYIVFMGQHSYPDSESVISSNHELLSSVVGSINEAKKVAVHHYTKSFRGFSAMLTPEQANKLSKSSSVVSIFESTVHRLHTTRSWDFLVNDYGSQQTKQLFETDSKQHDDVIIGHFDSGVWPESKSFSPQGLGPVPKRFKGECVTGERFTKDNCNEKIIGARYYYQGYVADNGPLDAKGPVIMSPRDDYGHGSHTASTAAGAEVNVYTQGFGNQTARGGAPKARLAVYKICWHNECDCGDILKAFDDAIHDGVDIITISVCPTEPLAYFNDCFSVGAIHAFMRGILVSLAGGNAGNKGYGTVANIAPWMLISAAGTIDRQFYTSVTLGNGQQLKGYGFNVPQAMLRGYHPVIYGSWATAPGVDFMQASHCKPNTLNYELIRGKIVICTTENSNEEPLVKSSEVAQGGGVGVIVVEIDAGGQWLYNFPISTSIIGYDDAQILDAYMGSSSNPVVTSIQDNTGGLIRSGSGGPTPFDFGSGLLNPNQALDPGLVYDFDTDDIVNFLCTYGASKGQLQNLIGKQVECNPQFAMFNLNYPSIGIGRMNGPMSVYRTVTYKGKENDPKVYKAYIEYPPGVELSVAPDILDFSNNSTKATYRIDFRPFNAWGYVYGSITWTDGVHNVRSPIVINVAF